MHTHEALLMTATISPQNVPSLKITDSQERLQQYLQAIVAWIKLSSISTIVFCENSNASYDFSKIVNFAKQEGKTLEVLQFQGNQNASKYGKGYGEGLIIKHAINNSKYLDSMTNLYKITGRLFVPEFDKIQQLHSQISNAFKIPAWQATDASWIDTSKWGADEKASKLKLNLRFLKTYFAKGFRPPHNYNRHVSTIFFKTNVNFYKQNLLNTYKRINDNIYYCLEHAFYEDLIKKDFTPFILNYTLMGRSGGHGKVLDHDYPDEIKTLARTFI